MQSSVSFLIDAADHGDTAAVNTLFSILYSELHQLAKRELARRSVPVTLGATTQENSIANFASGSFSTDAGTPADYNIYTGFKPRYIRVINITDLLQYEWMVGLTNPGALLTTGSTGVITNSAP